MLEGRDAEYKFKMNSSQKVKPLVIKKEEKKVAAPPKVEPVQDKPNVIRNKNG